MLPKFFGRLLFLISVAQAHTDSEFESFFGSSLSFLVFFCVLFFFLLSDPPLSDKLKRPWSVVSRKKRAVEWWKRNAIVERGGEKNKQKIFDFDSPLSKSGDLCAVLELAIKA